ncbi:MAG: hypothetical protein ABI626_05100 [Sphingomicrobium sp.]
MTKLFLAAGVAALAIAAPAAADRGGHGGNAGHSAKAQRGGKADRRGAQRVAKNDRGHGHGSRAAKADRHPVKVASRNRGAERHFATIDRHGRGNLRIAERGGRHDGVRAFNSRGADRFGRRVASNWSNGCPPGLAKKNNGCLPPGHAKRLDFVGRALPAAYSRGIVPRELRDYYHDSDDSYYRYGDGYMYRVDRRTNLVTSLLPLLGGGYVPGQQFPSSYRNSYVPSYYQSFYPDTADNYYRYANGNVYGIDAYSGMIDNVIPMYGNGYGYGQMLPSSYSAYNVPYQYRSMYADSSDYHYRYAPGAIYQVDPGSNLITGVALLLAGDLGVGSRLPLGYSAYNVPMAYRSTYYDTSNDWYRYNDGYIYRVDPTTQLVTAVINAIA